MFTRNSFYRAADSRRIAALIFVSHSGGRQKGPPGEMLSRFAYEVTKTMGDLKTHPAK